MMNDGGSPTYRMYSPGQIALGALLGTPAYGCWLLSRSYLRLGLSRAASRCLWWGVAGMIALFVFAAFLPENFPNHALPIGCAMALLQTTRQLMGGAINRHVANGGRLESWLRVTCIGLLIGVTLAAFLFGVEFMLSREV